MSKDVNRLIVVGLLIALVGAVSAAASPRVSLGLAELGLAIDPLLAAVLVAALLVFAVSQVLIVGRIGADASVRLTRIRPIDALWLAAPLLLVAGVTGWTLAVAQ